MALWLSFNASFDKVWRSDFCTWLDWHVNNAKCLSAIFYYISGPHICWLFTWYVKMMLLLFGATFGKLWLLLVAVELSNSKTSNFSANSVTESSLNHQQASVLSNDFFVTTLGELRQAWVWKIAQNRGRKFDQVFPAITGMNFLVNLGLICAYTLWWNSAFSVIRETWKSIIFDPAKKYFRARTRSKKPPSPPPSSTPPPPTPCLTWPR